MALVKPLSPTGGSDLWKVENLLLDRHGGLVVVLGWRQHGAGHLYGVGSACKQAGGDGDNGDCELHFK
jgi:hypothetical protein